MPTNPTRELLFNLIVERYPRLDEVCPSCEPGEDGADYETVRSNYRALQEKQITIENFLNLLSDRQLIDAYDAQCCLDYR